MGRAPRGGSEEEESGGTRLETEALGEEFRERRRGCLGPGWGLIFGDERSDAQPTEGRWGVGVRV